MGETLLDRLFGLATGQSWVLVHRPSLDQYRIHKVEGEKGTYAMVTYSQTRRWDIEKQAYGDWIDTLPDTDAAAYTRCVLHLHGRMPWVYDVYSAESADKVTLNGSEPFYLLGKQKDRDGITEYFLGAAKNYIVALHKAKYAFSTVTGLAYEIDIENRQLATYDHDIVHINLVKLQHPEHQLFLPYYYTSPVDPEKNVEFLEAAKRLILLTEEGFAVPDSLTGTDQPYQLTAMAYDVQKGGMFYIYTGEDGSEYPYHTAAFIR